MRNLHTHFIKVTGSLCLQNKHSEENDLKGLCELNTPIQISKNQ